MAKTFLWYDLETFGRDPARSRIAQFGAIRTDTDLNPVEEPLMWFCRPTDDLLPSPTACLITGITPQKALAEGLPETEFTALIHEQMSRPDTCVAGYNSLRFDDNFIRNLFYRNFFDPYEREWRNGNSRWDMIDPVRMACALRPEGIEWPQREDGAPSFKLEDLAAANGLIHSRAHDALSDVEATIALAKQLKTVQPRLFDYSFALRDKQRAAALLDYVKQTPVLHISSRFPASQGCGALVLPLCPHPHVRNQIIVYDLSEDPTPLIELSVEEILQRLYVPREELPEGVSRIPLKQVHLNRAPILVELPFVEKLGKLDTFGIDLERQLGHAAQLRASTGLTNKIREIFDQPRDTAPEDVELGLYGGFPSPNDKRLFAAVRRQADRAPDGDSFGFDDARYEELAFRFRARNYPQSLSASDAARWKSYRQHRLAPGSGLSEYDFPAYENEIHQLREQASPDSEAHQILDALEAWGETLRQSL